MLFIPANTIKAYLALSLDQLRRLIHLPCGHQEFFFCGTYWRKIRPTGTRVWIRRVCCRICNVTHAVLPSFLLGRVHYSSHTVTTYFEQAVKHNLSAIQVWQRDLSDGPQDRKTVYRWRKRLLSRLPLLLPRLKQELLMLAPHLDLTPLKNFILHAVPEVPAPTAASPAMLSPLALCQCGFWLSQQLLAVSSELLAITPDLAPVSFLNYVCWQKNHLALLAPLDKPPPA
jgi:hypothetical protein